MQHQTHCIPACSIRETVYTKEAKTNCTSHRSCVHTDRFNTATMHQLPPCQAATNAHCTATNFPTASRAAVQAAARYVLATLVSKVFCKTATIILHISRGYHYPSRSQRHESCHPHARPPRQINHHKPKWTKLGVCAMDIFTAHRRYDNL